MSTFTGEIHPLADAFPMLGDEDLDALAQSIRADGLQHPLVLDPDGVLLDGRNRLAACEIAGVQPAFVTYDGDPVGLIVAENMQRRHLTAGQRAMLGAQARRFETNRSLNEAAALVGVSKGRLAYAETILQYAPELADPVVAGTKPIDEAYDEARKRKKSVGIDTRMSRLREDAPDLADQVDDETLTLDEAVAALDARIGNARSAAKHLRQDIESIETLARGLRTTQTDGRLALAYKHREKRLTHEDIDRAYQELDRARTALDKITNHLKETRCLTRSTT
jgi:ParB-like chromosome segregation protein Spo0J